VKRETSLADLTRSFADGKIAIVIDGDSTLGLVTKIDLIEHLAVNARAHDADAA
jgi:hypothetical protein